ncbi:MAG: hypothetical protein HYV15_00870 [Elusimicrobia bacterium]|nr:hypothetical protein [Elusimicrobiota bacterium]
MAERLLSRLYGRPGFILVERTSLQQILSEHRLAATGAVDARKAQEIGRLLGADALVVGTVVGVGRSLELEARVVDVASGKVLAASQARLRPTGTKPSQPPPPPAPVPAPPRAAATASVDVPSSPDSLPWAIGAHGVALVGKRLYIVAGHSPKYVHTGVGDDAVLSVPILRSGRLGTWRHELPLPEGRYQIDAASWDGKVFAVGGYRNSPRPEVYVSAAGEDGRLGPWAVARSLPGGCTGGRAVAAAGRLYVTGCSAAGGPARDLKVAEIRRDGTLGPWTAVPMPWSLFNHALAVVGDRIVVAGGSQEGGAASSAVFAAPLGKDGVPGRFAPVGSLPSTLRNFALEVRGQELWVAGGVGPQGNSDAVFHARLGESGLGAWTRSATRLPVAVGIDKAPIAGGRLYVLGGSISPGNSTAVAIVPLNGSE